MMKLTIDGSRSRPPRARRCSIPRSMRGSSSGTFCKHLDLEAVGGCRLCAVEVNGSRLAVPACKTQVEEGVGRLPRRLRRPRTQDGHGAHSRHPPLGLHRLPWVRHLRVAVYVPIPWRFSAVSMRWRCRARTVPTDDSNPLITHMLTRCMAAGVVAALSPAFSCAALEFSTTSAPRMACASALTEASRSRRRPPLLRGLRRGVPTGFDRGRRGSTSPSAAARTTWCPAAPAAPRTSTSRATCAT